MVDRTVEARLAEVDERVHDGDGECECHLLSM